MRKRKPKLTRSQIKKLFEKKKINRSLLFQKSPVRISIKSPSEFKASIEKLKKKGVTYKERKAVRIAQARAAAQLLRKNLSPSERRQLREIIKMKPPKITKKNRPRDALGRFI